MKKQELLLHQGHQKKTQKNYNPDNINMSKQTQIIHYLTPLQSISQLEPSRLTKPSPTFSRPLSIPTTLLNEFENAIPAHQPEDQDRSRILPTAPNWKQVPLTNFFRLKPPQVRPPTIPQPAVTSKPAKPKSLRHALNTYKRPKRQLPKITRFTTTMLTYNLFDSWGHTLDTIDASSTFRVFLQNPNGLSIHKNNHLLLQDLQHCFDYGAGALCLLEMNTN